MVPDTRAAVRRFLAGHRAAALRQRELMREEGAHPDQAFAEFLSMLNVLEEATLWPGPRDPAAERTIDAVRRLWRRAKTRAISGRSR